MVTKDSIRKQEAKPLSRTRLNGSPRAFPCQNIQITDIARNYAWEKLEPTPYTMSANCSGVLVIPDTPRFPYCRNLHDFTPLFN